MRINAFVAGGCLTVLGAEVDGLELDVRIELDVLRGLERRRQAGMCTSQEGGITVTSQAAVSALVERTSPADRAAAQARVEKLIADVVAKRDVSVGERARWDDDGGLVEVAA